MKTSATRSSSAVTTRPPLIRTDILPPSAARLFSTTFEAEFGKRFAENGGVQVEPAREGLGYRREQRSTLGAEHGVHRLQERDRVRKGSESSDNDPRIATVNV